MTQASADLSDTVALVTGAASGIGAAVVDRLAERGARLALVDVDAHAVADKADQVGGIGLATDVSDPEAMGVAVTEAERLLGGLDLVHLNAGTVGGQTGLDRPLDVAAYRRLVGVNVDHVVFGLSAAVPALRRAGGGTVIATASLAGLVPLPADPLYTMTKHAVVGYVRAAGPVLVEDGIRVMALCPGFADTPLLAPSRERFGDFPLLTAGDVAAAVEVMLERGKAGEAWFVQPGRPPGPYAFRGAPGVAGGQAPPAVALDAH